MAFLPGWNRERLLTAPQEDVAAARLIAFGLEVRPILQGDYERQIDDLRDRTPAQQKLHDTKRRGEQIESLKEAWRTQVDLRRQLGLDDA